MKLTRLIAVTGLILSGITFAPIATADLQLGGKLGYYHIDFGERIESTPFIGVGIDIGYIFHKTASLRFGGEFEYNTSLFEGERNKRDYSFDSLGLLASMRTNGRYYFIGKLGVVSANIKYDTGASEDDLGGQLGLGMGIGKTEFVLDMVRFTDTEYTGVFLSAGINF